MIKINYYPNSIKRKWLLIDAKGVKLGRLASQISNILRGKDKFYFTPNINIGNNIIIINANYIAISGQKKKCKRYYTHTGAPGGIRFKVASQMSRSKVVYLAVQRMLPKESRLSRAIIKNLYIYLKDQPPYFTGNLHYVKLTK